MAAVATETYLPRFHVVLHQPEIPGNTGAVGRTCVALQAKLWLVRPLGFRIDEKSLRRAGLDYWQHLNWEVVDKWETMLKRMSVDAVPTRFWALTRHATSLFQQQPYTAGDWFVFGSETQGLPASVIDHPAATGLRIPVSKPVRSLNLSSSVAAVGYEAHRQLCGPLHPAIGQSANQ